MRDAIEPPGDGSGDGSGDAAAAGCGIAQGDCVSAARDMVVTTPPHASASASLATAALTW